MHICGFPLSRMFSMAIVVHLDFMLFCCSTTSLLQYTKDEIQHLLGWLIKKFVGKNHRCVSPNQINKSSSHLKLTMFDQMCFTKSNQQIKSHLTLAMFDQICLTKPNQQIKLTPYTRYVWPAVFLQIKSS